MTISEEEKQIRELKRQLNNIEIQNRNLYNELEIKKGICKYQENLINKLLNTIQKKELDINTDLLRGYE